MYALTTPLYGQLRVHTNGNASIRTTSNYGGSLNLYGNNNPTLSIRHYASGDWSWASIARVNRDHTKVWIVERSGWDYHPFSVLGEGWVYCRGTGYGSDIRFKKDIMPMERGNQLTNLYQLEAVSYKYNNPAQEISPSEDEENETQVNAEKKHADANPSEEQYAVKEESTQYGFIAQEMRKLYPELVMEDDAGYLYINYIGLIPLLVEALKEQQATIETLTTRLASLEQGNPGQGNERGKAKSASADTPGPMDSNAMIADPTTPQGDAYLAQNAPNPFSTDTRIGYYLPQGVGTATLYIYNMQGTQLKAYPLHLRGEGTHTILASELTPGMYLYTLIADCREVGTRRMILTK